MSIYLGSFFILTLSSIFENTFTGFTGFRYFSQVLCSCQCEDFKNFTLSLYLEVILFCVFVVTWFLVTLMNNYCLVFLHIVGGCLEWQSCVSSFLASLNLLPQNRVILTFNLTYSVVYAYETEERGNLNSAGSSTVSLAPQTFVGPESVSFPQMTASVSVNWCGFPLVQIFFTETFSLTLPQLYHNQREPDFLLFPTYILTLEPSPNRRTTSIYFLSVSCIS